MMDISHHVKAKEGSVAEGFGCICGRMWLLIPMPMGFRWNHHPHLTDPNRLAISIFFHMNALL